MVWCRAIGRALAAGLPQMGHSWWRDSQGGESSSLVIGEIEYDDG